MPSTRRSGWRRIAEQELRVARANGSLTWSVAGAVLFAVVVAAGITVISSRSWSGPDTVRLVAPALLLVVPVAAASANYAAVNAPRQSGLLRLPLSLPFSRRDVVVGTAIGRFAATALPVLVLVTATLAIAVFRPRPVDAVVVAGGVAVAGIALTAAFVGLAVGWSAATRTPARSLLGCLLVGGLLLRWWLPVDAARYVLNGFAWPTTPVPSWLAWYADLNPVNAYMTILNASGFPVDTTGNPAVAVSVLLAWAVIPVVLGSLRFASVDI